MLVATFISVLLVLGGPGSRANEISDTRALSASAEQRVAEMILTVDALSAKTNLSDTALSRQFHDIMTTYLDRSEMARAALGDAAWRLTSEDWERFLAAYSRHLELSFLRGIRETGASSSRLLGSRVTRDGRVVVFSRTVSGGVERDVTWIMCRRDPGLICDIETDGITASSHQRSVFADRLRTGGLDSLIRALKAGWLVEIP